VIQIRFPQLRQLFEEQLKLLLQQLPPLQLMLCRLDEDFAFQVRVNLVCPVLALDLAGRHRLGSQFSDPLVSIPQTRLHFAAKTRLWHGLLSRKLHFCENNEGETNISILI
jgi:hypothetical protein